MAKSIVTTLLIVLNLNIMSLTAADGHEVKNAHDYQERIPFIGERFARTELYFGTQSKSEPVTEQAFNAFLDQKITPAFPEGLTLLKGSGQFRGADGVTIKEDSYLVILLYPADLRWINSSKIEQIREDYKQQFEQESVLRSDSCCERVGF